MRQVEAFAMPSFPPVQNFFVLRVFPRERETFSPRMATPSVKHLVGDVSFLQDNANQELARFVLLVVLVLIIDAIESVVGGAVDMDRQAPGTGRAAGASDGECDREIPWGNVNVSGILLGVVGRAVAKVPVPRRNRRAPGLIDEPHCQRYIA